MKQRSTVLFEKSCDAFCAAIEVYNQPRAAYREEAFCILAVNAWELLLKARIVQLNKNNIKSICVRTRGTACPKGQRYKKNRTGNVMTLPILDAAEVLRNLPRPDVPPELKANIEALVEIRDNAVHLYNSSGCLSERVRALGTASLANYVEAARSWFGKGLREFDFFQLPVSFFPPHAVAQTGAKTPREVERLLRFLAGLEGHVSSLPSGSPYAMAIHLEAKLVRGSGKDAVAVRLTNDPRAPVVQLTDDEFKRHFPLTHDSLRALCSARYVDFRSNRRFHALLRPLKNDPVLACTRRLNPQNPKSASQTFFSERVLANLDAHYRRKGSPQ